MLRQTERRKEGQILHHRTLPATTGGPIKSWKCDTCVCRLCQTFRQNLGFI